MKEIWFIKHAESENVPGIKYINTIMTPLTDKGKKQANNLATYLFFVGEPDLIICSKYKRTIDTVMPFMDCFPQTPMEEWPVHDFIYICEEKHSNTSSKDKILAKYEYWQKCNPDYVDGPKSESFSYFMDRVTDTIDLLMQRDEKMIFVFSNEWFIKAIMWTIYNRSFHKEIDYDWTANNMKQLYAFWSSFSFPNTGILKVCSDGDNITTNTWVLDEYKL